MSANPIAQFKKPQRSPLRLRFYTCTLESASYAIGTVIYETSDTEKQIVKAQEDYDAAKAQEDAQYLAMKKRLRYLYEKGDTSYIEILSNASNWSGMLNQANYVEKLYEYDKQMLNRYILIKEEVAQKKNDLEDKKERPGNAEI